MRQHSLERHLRIALGTLAMALVAAPALMPSPSRAEAPPAAAAAAPAEKSVDAPDGMRVSVKMIGPVTQATDLQVICILKHDSAGDKYIEAMADFNSKLGGLIAGLRDRGEFAGDMGETLLFTPPAESIAPKRVLLVGVGDESALTLDTMRVVGRIIAREAVRVGAAHVSFAPTLRDQGSTRLDVAEGDAAVAGQMVLAYDTERRLQAQGLAAKAPVTEFTIEAGPKYFGGAAEQVAKAVAAAADQISRRDAGPYRAAAAAGK